jgi:hypothetical protein
MHGAEVPLEIIEDRMFEECISPTHIEIPPTVTDIGVAAFQYCKGLKHLRIPSNVTRIERAPFVQCTRLIPLELPEGLVLEAELILMVRNPTLRMANFGISMAVDPW